MSARQRVIHAAARCITPLSFSLAMALAHAVPTAAATCESLSSVEIPFSTITTAQSVPAGTFNAPDGTTYANLPAFCRVALTMVPAADSNIRVEVWMPISDWTGRYQGTGGGGYTGQIFYSELANALRLGYAVANSDMGTAPATIFDGIPIVGHPERWLDFGSRSTHEMTVAAKTVIRAFYEKAPDHSYFVGCSTGGHQGLMEAQVFPDDYDGILAGSPGHNRTHLHTAFVWNYVVSHKAPGVVIPQAKLSLLNSAVLSACVGKDGGASTDGFLTDPHECNFEPATIQCTGAASSGCLTAAEVYTAEKFYDGPRNPRTGARIYPGWPRGSEIGWDVLEGSAPAFEGILNWALGENYDRLAVDFDTDVSTVDATLAPSVNFMSTDLHRFDRHGGKLLIYHGTAEAIVVARDTINYYERIMSEQNLSLKHTQSFARLFMVPGMGHCDGGPGPNAFDALQPLVDWVENGVPPREIMATKFVNDSYQDFYHSLPLPVGPAIEMTRPICAYPAEAHYQGAGNPKMASSFACVVDRPDRAVISSELPAREYLAPIVIQADAPDVLNLRKHGGMVTVVLTVADGSDSFREWTPSNVKAEGAAAVSSALSQNGKKFVVRFNRDDLRSFTGGGSVGEKVDLMITGDLEHDGSRSLFAASATVKVSR